MINRTPSMILGLDKNEDNNNQNEKGTYGLESVAKYNEKTYVSMI